MSNTKPSVSPENADAEFFSNVARVFFLRKIETKKNQEAADIAEKIFDVLKLFDDHAILEAQIDFAILDKIDDEAIKNEPRMKNYLMIVNNLLKLANNSEIGAIKFLDRKIVKDFDITTAAIAKCIGGGDLLDILCDVVNEELSARRPTFSPRKIEARAAF